MGTFREYHQLLEQEEDALPRGPELTTTTIGRFVIPHRIHTEMFLQLEAEALREGYDRFDIGIVHGLGTGQDELRNPTTFDQRAEMITEILRAEGTRLPFGFILLRTGFLGDLVNEARRQDAEPMLLLAGPDRVNSYRRQLQYVREMDSELQVEEFRPVGDAEVRGTLVRQAIRDDDQETFERMVPDAIHRWWQELRRTLL